MAHAARREAATLPPVTLPAKLTRRDVDDAFSARDEKKSNADEDSGSAAGAASSLSGSAYFCASCDAALARHESVRSVQVQRRVHCSTQIKCDNATTLWQQNRSHRTIYDPIATIDER